MLHDGSLDLASTSRAVPRPPANTADLRYQLIGALQLSDHKPGSVGKTSVGRTRRGLHLRISHGFLQQLDESAPLGPIDLFNRELCLARIEWLEDNNFPAQHDPVLTGLRPGGAVPFLPSGSALAPDTPPPVSESAPAESVPETPPDRNLARLEGFSEVEGKGTLPSGRNLPPEPPVPKPKGVATDPQPRGVRPVGVPPTSGLF